MSWKKKPISSLFLAFLLLSTGCGYSPRPFLRAEFRTIALDNLENRTYEHGLEMKVAESVRDEFIFDGTLKVVEEAQADLLLSGAVTGYTFEPLARARDGKAESHRLRIRTKLTLKNLRTEEVIWQDRNIEGDAHYLLSGPLAGTETQARDKALQDLAREILRQIIDLW